MLTYILHINNNHAISLNIEADSVCQIDRPSTGVYKESSGREMHVDVAEKETTSNHLAIERHLEKQKNSEPARRPEIPRASAKRPKRASAESATCDNPRAGRM